MGVTLLVAVVFFAVTLTVGAIAMVVRDVTVARRAEWDRRLGTPAAAATEHFEFQTPPTSWIDRRFYNLLDAAGSNLSPASALFLVAGLAIVGCAAPLLLLENLPIAAAGLLLAVSLPLLFWTIRAAWRLSRMRKMLPDALAMLADSVRSGRNLEQAIQTTAAQAPAPLDRAFGEAAGQLRLGQTPVATLDRLASRVPLSEIRIFSTAALVHRQTGGNLGLLVERLAQAARERQEFRTHVRAVTAGSRMSAIGLLVASIIAVALLASMQPAYLEVFWTHRYGMPLLVTAGVLQLVGIVWVSRIMKVEY